jgi:hypothetical protein
MRCDSTLEYVARAAAAVLAETGLLPHINAGVMGLEDVRALLHLIRLCNLPFTGFSLLPAPPCSSGPGCM